MRLPNRKLAQLKFYCGNRGVYYVSQAVTVAVNGTGCYVRPVAEPMNWPYVKKRNDIDIQLLFDGLHARTSTYASHRTVSRLVYLGSGLMQLSSKTIRLEKMIKEH